MLLTEALHARPASLLVRLAQRFSASITVRHVARGKQADAKSILSVLRLAARPGDAIEIEASGEDAPAALAALTELVTRGFAEDLVPEFGAAAVEGIAVGAAVVVTGEEEGATQRRPMDARLDPSRERARVADAVARVTSDLDAMIASLPAAEAALFAPERAMVRELEAKLTARVEAGASAEDAVRAETDEQSTDLFVDARVRLLDALGGGHAARLSRALASQKEACVLVTDVLTPSTIARLPGHVVGVVAAASEGATGTSHATILARGRGLPLLVVDSFVLASIAHGRDVVLDTTQTPARLWVTPSPALVHEARVRRDALSRSRADELARAKAPLRHLAAHVRVNVSSPADALPDGAEGIGLVRTELVFAARAARPSDKEQEAAYATIAARATERCGAGAPIVVRLFDAGGDKPCAWLPPPSDAPDARGIELLLRHEDVLDAQLRAIEAATAKGDARVLIPLVRDARDVEAVRRRAGALSVGAMIETKEAAAIADEIAAASDFVSIGTNDLTASTLGIERGDTEKALDPRVLANVRRIVEAAHAHGREVSVCGELAADPRGARVLVGLGVDTLSVAPSRLASLRLSLQEATVDECRAAAAEILGGAS